MEFHFVTSNLPTNPVLVRISKVMLGKKQSSNFIGSRQQRCISPSCYVFSGDLKWEEGLCSSKTLRDPGYWKHMKLKTKLRINSIFFYFLHSIWDLSSPTSDQTHIPCIGIADS